MFGIGITIFKLEKGHPNTLETKITKIQWVIVFGMFSLWSERALCLYDQRF